MQTHTGTLTLTPASASIRFHLRYPSIRYPDYLCIIHPSIIETCFPGLHIHIQIHQPPHPSLAPTLPLLARVIIPTMSSTPFKGSLKQKRKAELTEIAQALGIGLDQSQKKEELEDLIREHLISHKNQYSSNENFKGLIDSLDSAGRRRSARSSSVNGNA